MNLQLESGDLKRVGLGNRGINFFEKLMTVTLKVL